jgi:signal transduction histidine kinase
MRRAEKLDTLSRRVRLVYGALFAVWGMILVWQAVEHARVRQTARVALVNRAKDISTTLGVVLRSQRHFGVISQDRLESALDALITPQELNAVALLNATGDVVASAGSPIDFEVKGLAPTGEHWGKDTVVLMNLVDLGTNMTAEAEGNRPPIILPRGEMFSPFGTNRPAEPPRGGPPPLGPPPEPGDRTNIAFVSPGPREGTNAAARPRRWPRSRGGDGRAPFGRPFWMSEEEYQSAIEKKGVHSFVMVLSSQSVRAVSSQDLWLRSLITALASVSVVGLGLAWRNLAKSSELEVRLVRAAELNSRLKEMNLAAAGLAHETKNPLNIIRGLAQMLSRREDAPTEVRQKAREMVDETDRVTAQLNEFINYSRPREVRRASVSLHSVVADVARALNYDLEEKKVRLQPFDQELMVEADEQLLRQALFNLVLNAIQAVDRQGEIQIFAGCNGTEAFLEIRDNGPGVPPEHRAEIFKPYFTTHENGTGLGLAVVQQIVLAHGWEIECLSHEPRGALFRLTHLRLVPER